MFKNLNKRISTPIAIEIILVLAVLVGGFTLWQYSEMEKEESGGQINVLDIKSSIEGNIEQYLGEDVIMYGVSMPPEAEYQAISEEKAILLAVKELEEQGANNIMVKQLLWTIAPTGKFFIAGDCSLTKENKQYSKFVAKVSDGSAGEPGKPTLIFKGTDIWYSNSPSDEWLDEIVANYETAAEEIYHVNSVFKNNNGENETAVWKIYRNEEYGFEIKHPEDWEVEGTNCIFFEDNTLRICINAEPTLDACLVPACSFETSVKIAGIETNKTISAIWGWIGYDEEGYGRVTYDDGEISCHEVRDKECIPCEKEEKMSKEDCEKLPYRINITSEIPFKDGFFIFSFLCPDWQGTEGVDKCIQLYDQMLSTFRFIE